MAPPVARTLDVERTLVSDLSAMSPFDEYRRNGVPPLHQLISPSIEDWYSSAS